MQAGKTVEQVLLAKVAEAATFGAGAVAVGAIFKILSKGAVRIANSGIAPTKNAIFALADVAVGSQRALRGVLPRLRGIAGDVRVGVRGSVARGLKGPQKDFAPFDATKFDVDAFIISDTLANASKTRITPKGFRFSTDRQIREIQREMQRTLKRQFPGLKGGRDRFTFRIFTQDEFNRLTDSPHFFVD